MNTIQSEFEDFRAEALPANASDVELKLFRSLFFSGAIAALAIVEKIEQVNLNKAAASAMRKKLKQEGLDFMQEVMGE